VLIAFSTLIAQESNHFPCACVHLHPADSRDCPEIFGQVGVAVVGNFHNRSYVPLPVIHHAIAMLFRQRCVNIEIFSCSWQGASCGRHCGSQPCVQSQRTEDLPGMLLAAICCISFSRPSVVPLPPCLHARSIFVTRRLP
jgi:hypothetical protein